MRSQPGRGGARERGMALITSLLLLVVVTILAISMFRSFAIEGKIAGNVREKQRALLAAESAQQYAEWWLTQGSNAGTLSSVCSQAMNANIGEAQICANTLPTILGANNNAGQIQLWPAFVTSYTPPSMNVTQTASQGTYYQAPVFYISDLGTDKDGSGGEVFQIDAMGYGASADTVAVVESTFVVNSGVPCYSCSP
jgi:type IV pilus assembly protein PilX